MINLEFFNQNPNPGLKPGFLKEIGLEHLKLKTQVFIFFGNRVGL